MGPGLRYYGLGAIRSGRSVARPRGLLGAWGETDGEASRRRTAIRAKPVQGSAINDRQPPTTNHGPPTTNHEPPTTNHGPRTTDHEPRTTDHEPRTTNHRPRTTNHRPPTTNHRPPTTNHQPPTTNHQPRTTDRGPPTTYLGMTARVSVSFRAAARSGSLAATKRPAIAVWPGVAGGLQK